MSNTRPDEKVCERVNGTWQVRNANLHPQHKHEEKHLTYAEPKRASTKAASVKAEHEARLQAFVIGLTLMIVSGLGMVALVVAVMLGALK